MKVTRKAVAGDNGATRVESLNDSGVDAALLLQLSVEIID